MENYLNYLGIREISELIRKRVVTPADLVRHCLDKVDKFNPRFNTFITVLGDEALKEAHEMETEIKNGNWKGLLHGIPVAVKDFYDTAGIKTTAGSQQFKDRIPANDAAVVTRLKKAGAIIIGKTNMHELGMGTTSLESYYGSVHNPWNDKYVAGGSSGGSAAAIATGMCYATIDTDAVGSCRLPAACCGITGLKTSNDLISMKGILEGEKADEMIVLLSAVGISARSAADAGIVLNALQEKENENVVSTDKPSPNVTIGIVNNFKATKDIKQSIIQSIAVLEALGLETTEVSLPFDKAKFDPTNLAEHRKKVKEMLFDKADILVLPTLSTAPPTTKDARASGPQAVGPENTFISNYFGVPAISVCCGFDQNKMPLSIQFIAPPHKEKVLIDVARKFQEIIQPQLWSPPLGL